MFLGNLRLSMLDALAEGESTAAAREEGISPYFVLYGGGSFEQMPDRPGYYGFPEWGGRDNSHAAGRYQFEPATWKGQAEKLGLTNFRDPAQQDIAAWDLAATVYHTHTRRGLDTDLLDLRLDDVAPVLHSTWTSLSEHTFPSRFKAAMAARVGRPVEQPPEPPPTVSASAKPTRARRKATPPVPPADPSLITQVEGVIEGAAQEVATVVDQAAQCVMDGKLASELDPANFFVGPKGG